MVEWLIEKGEKRGRGGGNSGSQVASCLTIRANHISLSLCLKFENWLLIRCFNSYHIGSRYLHDYLLIFCPGY